MQALTFQIRLLEPVLATQAQSGEANSATAYTFIPGSMIRGALIGRYLKGESKDAAGDALMQKLFFNETVRYLNAYLAHPSDNTRMLPKPLSWFVSKDEVKESSATVYDFAVQEAKELNGPKPPQGDFCWKGDETVQLGAPEMQVTVHNASDDRNRKSEGESQVYRYDAISAGEVLAGVILSEDQKLLTNELQPLLANGTLVLGGSNTGGYGLVKITDIKLESNWKEFTPEAATPELRDKVILTCLSDIVLRSSNGQIDGDLEALFGAAPNQIFRRMRLVGGFNRTWGLPLPQAWAIQAGSVFVFDGEHRAKLEAFVEKGIGERRAEGFGRIAINWNTRATRKKSELPLRKLEVKAPKKLSLESEAFAQRMATRRLQFKIEQAVIKKISDSTSGHEPFQNLPSPAQLSRARLAARQAWHSEKLEEITAHFNSLSDLTKREWKNARMQGELLREWIDKQISDQDFINSLVPEPPSFAGKMAQFEELRTKTVARLIDGVLKQAVLVAKKKAEGERE